MNKKPLFEFGLLLLLGPLFPASSAAFGPAAGTTANAYMVENTSGTSPTGAVCYDFITRPGCSATIANLTPGSLPSNSTAYIQNTPTPTTATQQFSVSTGTFTTGLFIKGFFGNSLATAPGPFHSTFTYVALGSTQPVHIFESYEPWSGDNSTRWVLSNTDNGYAVIDARTGVINDGSSTANPVLGTADAKIFAAGYGASSNWATGVPIANSGGFIVSSSSETVFDSTNSSITFVTEKAGLNFMFAPNMVPAVYLSSSGYAFADNTYIQAVIASSQNIVNASSATTASNYIPTGNKVTMTPHATANKFRLSWSGTVRDSNPTGDVCKFSIFANGTNIVSDAICLMSQTSVTSVNMGCTMGPLLYSPNSVSAQTFEVYMETSAAGSTCTINPNNSGIFLAEEIKTAP